MTRRRSGSRAGWRAPPPTAACRTSSRSWRRIAESGLRNLHGDSYHGFFGMHESLNAGDYRGFPRNPQLQLNWFLDSAGRPPAARGRGTADPAKDEPAFGIWIADVERPAPQNRSGYQPHLAEARELIAGKCAAPVSDDTTPPRLAARIARPQHPLTTGGIVVRCAAPTTTASPARRPRSASAPAERRPGSRPPRGFTVLSVAVPRRARRALQSRAQRARAGHGVRRDAAANVRTRRRSVLLLP